MRFITCRLPDGVEDPAILSEDGRQVWPLSWLGLSYETLSDAIPFLTPQVRAGLQLAIAGIPALPVDAVQLQSPIPCPAQDVVCLGINYMAHSDEAEKYSADAFATKHQDAIYFSKRVSRAVPDGGFIEAHTDLVQKLEEGHTARLMAEGLPEKQARAKASKQANEDARFVLPNACETKMVVTMNARSLQNFFHLRCCSRAQWEIRQLAEEMFRLVYPVAPHIFAKAGPACVSGPCPEGKMCCGRTAEVRAKYEAIKQEAGV